MDYQPLNGETEMTIQELFLKAWGEADDLEQAQVLSDLAESLWEACKGDFDLQVWYISKHLSVRTQDFILSLAKYTSCRQREPVLSTAAEEANQDLQS